ncbi:MAG: restriction endonuclease subunit S, partial [Nitrospinae bacterium]|nr:restriction endonuclease subunit S [Nitrospinota bacterium]
MEKWISKSFEDCIHRIKSPKKIPRKQFLNEGLYPIISQEKDFINGFWSKEEDIIKLVKPVVIFGDHTKVLKYVDFDFV